MDKTDERILDLMKGNARISFQELGDAIGMSRVAAKKPFHIHIVAVSDCLNDLKYLLKMIQKACGDDCTEIHCHAVKEVIKDVYGGITYDQRERRETDGNNGFSGGSASS